MIAQKSISIGKFYHHTDKEILSKKTIESFYTLHYTILIQIRVQKNRLISTGNKVTNMCPIYLWIRRLRALILYTDCSLSGVTQSLQLVVSATPPWLGSWRKRSRARRWKSPRRRRWRWTPRPCDDTRAVQNPPCPTWNRRSLRQQRDTHFHIPIRLIDSFPLLPGVFEGVHHAAHIQESATADLQIGGRG